MAIRMRVGADLLSIPGDLRKARFHNTTSINIKEDTVIWVWDFNSIIN